MTTEEAIKQLKEYILGMNYMDDEAVWMAIKALEAYRAHQEFMEYLKNNPVGGYKGDNHNW